MFCKYSNVLWFFQREISGIWTPACLNHIKQKTLSLNRCNRTRIAARFLPNEPIPQIRRMGSAARVGLQSGVEEINTFSMRWRRSGVNLNIRTVSGDVTVSQKRKCNLIGVQLFHASHLFCGGNSGTRRSPTKPETCTDKVTETRFCPKGGPRGAGRGRPSTDLM